MTQRLNLPPITSPSRAAARSTCKSAACAKHPASRNERGPDQNRNRAMQFALWQISPVVAETRGSGSTPVWFARREGYATSKQIDQCARLRFNTSLETPRHADVWQLQAADKRNPSSAVRSPTTPQDTADQFEAHCNRLEIEAQPSLATLQPAREQGGADNSDVDLVDGCKRDRISPPAQLRPAELKAPVCF